MMDRRNFLRTGFLLIGGALLAPVSMVFARTAASTRSPATTRAPAAARTAVDPSVMDEMGLAILNESDDGSQTDVILAEQTREIAS